MDHHLLLIIHLIGASVWVGGHLYLVVCILPGVLWRRNPRTFLAFEKRFEPLGIPALIVMVVTGIWMAYQLGVGVRDWFSFSTPIERVVSIKLLLLIATVLFALSAQFKVIPSLKFSSRRLNEMAFHAVVVTLLGIAMLVLGSFVRYGGL